MAGLHFDITGDNSNFLRKLEESRNGVRSTSKQIEDSGMSIEQMFGRMTTAAAAFGVSLGAKQLVSDITRVRGEFQQLEVAFNTMLGSKEQADTLMSQLVRTAAITPFDLQGVANGAKQLLAYGTAAEDVNATLVRLGDIAAGLSIPLNDLVWLYGTTMTQGRLFTQDLRQFQGRGIPLADELAKQFGVAKDKVSELVTAGKIGFPEVQKAIEAMTNEGGKFGGLMEAQSKTITGQISNIEDAIATMFNQIGKENESVINGSLSSVSYLVEHWQEVAIAIESAAVAYGTYKAAVMATAALQGVEQTLKVDAEIEGLKSLLLVKEESKNADIAAAVASGKLTESKATELTMLREELTLKISTLEAQNALAEKEYANALLNATAAEKRLQSAQDAVDGMDDWIARAEDLGNTELANTYRTQLAEKSTELQSAAIARNSAQKALNDAATKKKSTSEALNTVTVQANTVANHANTASMNIMKLAAIQLTTILKGMWATLMANPLLLVTGAFIGLSFTVYKVATAESEAEKATRLYNEAIDEQQKKQDEYKERIDKLVKSIDDSTKSEGERLQAFEALKAEYPTIFNNLLTEAEYLKDILKYKKLIAEEDNNRAKKSDAEILEEEKRKLGWYRQMKKQGVHLVDMDGNGWASDNVEKAIKYQQEVVNKAIAKVASHNMASFLGNIKDMKNEDIISVIDGINSSLKTLRKSGDDAIAIVAELGGEFSKQQLSSIKNALETEQKTRSTEKNTGREWVEKYKNNYLIAKKDLDDFLNTNNSLTEIEYERKLKELTDAKDEAEKKYKSVGGITGSNQKSQADKLRQQQEKYALLMNKQALEQKRSAEDLQIQTDQARINAMKDGSIRTLEQMKLDHQKEMQQLDRQREDFLRKKIEDEKAKFDAKEGEKAAKDANYVKKTFDGSNVALSQSEKNAFDMQRMYLSIQQANETHALLDKERQAWDEYLAEYGNFQEKKEAITIQYNEKIASASTLGEKNSLKKDLENKLKDLNFDELKSSINFADIFGDLDSQSTEALGKMRDKLKEIIEASAKDLKPTDLKALQDAFKEIDLKVAGRNPFGELKHGIDGYKDAAKDVIKAQQDLNTLQQGGEIIIGTYTDSTGKIVKKLLTQAQAEKNLAEVQGKRKEAQVKLTQSVNAIGNDGKELVQAGNDLCDMLASLGVEMPKEVTVALEGMGQVIDSLSSIDFTNPFSIIKGATGALAGIVKTIGGLFGGKKHVISEETFAEYDRLIDAIDELISKQNELVKNSDSISAEIAANEAKALAKRKKQAAQNLNLDYLNSYDGSKHTVGYNLAKDLSGYRDAIKNAGIDWDVLYGTGRMEGLANLDVDQIKLLQGLPEVWAKLPERVQGYLNDVVKAAESAEEATEGVKENLTGMTFDGFKNSFLDTLKNLDSSSKDFADNLEGYIRDAMLQSLVDTQFNHELKALYEKFVSYRSKDSDGGDKITEAELEDLREEQKRLAEQILDERDAMADIFGWKSESTSQSSTSRGFGTEMTHEDAGELSGRFTALQIVCEDAKNAMLSMLTIANVLSVSVNSNSAILLEIKNLMVSSNGYLEDIAGYTKKILDGFSVKLDSINNNIEKAI